MKKVIKKIAKIGKLIFGYGMMITLFVGGLTFFGYLAAIIVGGDSAAMICDFLYNKIIPIIVYATNILIIWGIICMYLDGEKALTTSKRK